jgi:hypothetical protein
MRRVAAALLALPLLTCAGPPPDGRCALEIDLLLDGRSVPGLVRVLDGRGEPVALEGLLARGMGLEAAHAANRWRVLSGPSTVRVPRGRTVIEAFHGLETELARAELDLSNLDRARAGIPLVRFHDAAKRGWRGANTHLHLQKIPRREADRYLREVPRADGLDVLFVSYLERAEVDREYVTNSYTDADLKDLGAATGVVYGNGEEHRHNFLNAGDPPGQSYSGEGYGHVMFLDLEKLVRPVSIGRGIMKEGTDGMPLQRGIDEARKQGATVIWCHNTFGLEDIPNWATGRPHAQNIFDGSPEGHGTYQDTFYRYLNAGLRVPFSTGTDWFIYDFSRAYAPVASLRGPRDWLGALEEGRTYITNGPLLDFEVQGKGPGETVRLEGPGRVRVRGRAAGRVDFRRLELVRNGEADLMSEGGRVGGHFEASVEADLEISGPCWIALRTPPPPTKESPDPAFARNELGGAIFAHTSPVYVEVAGRGVRSEETVRGLLEEVRRARETIEKRGLFAGDHEKAHVLAVYASAATALERMLNR